HHRHPAGGLSVRIQPDHQGGSGAGDPGAAIAAPGAGMAVLARQPARRPQPPRRRERSREMNIRALPLYVTIAIFLLAYLVCWTQFPAMLSTRVIGNLLTDNAYLGIVAV